MGLFRWLVDHIAPIFLITSPITSYADQIYSIHNTRTSSGFSLDIPLIMLLASILKVYYWLGARYDIALLVQAVVMILMQILLLHVALTHRPPLQIHHTPFMDTAARIGTIFENRPYQFWQWRNAKVYWQFLAYFTLALFVGQLLFNRNESLYSSWTTLLGYTALAIEATLPLPQIMANQRRRCCKGFRLSVLANWLIGDAFKMVFFFVKDSSDVPWAFKLCGVFQAMCDCYLGVQYYMFGDGEPVMASHDGVIKAKMSMDAQPDRPNSVGIEMNGWNGKS
ncbi:uncharacterized protein PV09_02058 [Verruconis gallopava]|uniref:PQ loop repeat protein n=1 Tax=Verruconis gallopava TaxID=253628 RepID=A0A0D1Z2L1_9PEZI|nr:uncharacterized protein PV09_02058 [Verruconis gallopava]KIW07192.1 hypothetical protein PV09_02058 [Verruconis gallopava]